MQKHAFPKILVTLFTIFSALVVAQPASADTMSLMWDPNPESQVAGYIVHVGTQPGTYTQYVDVGLTTTWSYTSAVAGQQYCFAVSAYFAGPLEGPRSGEVCGFSNAPPTLVDPGAQSSTVGQADSLQIAGNDPKGDPLTYSATGLPPGLTVMASTGYISGTPTTAGTYSVTARAFDGVLTASQTFTWTVSVADTTPPVVSITGPTSAATYATSTTTVTLSGTAGDANGVTQVKWVNSRGGSGTASGTATWSVSAITLQVGSNVLTVTARDAAGNTASDVLTVTVNAPPTLASVANQSSVTGLSTTLQLVGSDPNGDTLTYSATGLPTGLSVGGSSGLISGTPTLVGTYNVTVSVSDGALSASRTFTWTVTAGSLAPGTLRLAWDAVADSGVLGYKVYVGSQSGVYGQTFDAGLTTTWTFSNPVAGQRYCFAVTAYIAGSVEGPKSTEVCGYSNQAPTLASIANQSTNVGQSATLQLSGSDPDGATLTYSATGLPNGLSVVPSTGLISGTPTTSGVLNVTATVSDGVLTASRTFTWTVVAPDTTSPAVSITSPTTASSFTTSAATLSLAGTASDNISVTQVSWVNSRGGSGVAAGTTTWSVGITLQSGSNVLTVTARDAAGNTSTDILTVTYSTGDATAPVISITKPTTGATYTTSKSTVTTSGTATDNVGVTRVAWSNDRGGSGTATGTASWSVTGIVLQPGINVLTVTASDAAGNMTSDVVTVTFTDPLRVASLTADRTAPQPLGTTVTFTAVGAGGTGPYEYQWRVFDGTRWVNKTTWSSSNRFIWTPTMATSAYQVRAVVRSATGTTAMATMNFPIVP